MKHNDGKFLSALLFFLFRNTSIKYVFHPKRLILYKTKLNQNNSKDKHTQKATLRGFMGNENNFVEWVENLDEYLLSQD